MPSVQQFASLCCSSCTALVLGLSNLSGMAGKNELTPPPLSTALPPLGMQKCGNCDTEEVAAIADALLHTVSVLVVEKNARNPFGSAQVKMEEIRKGMLEYVNKVSDEYKQKKGGAVPAEGSPPETAEKPSEVVKQMLEGYAGSTRNLFTQLSTKIVLGDKKDSTVDQIVAELEKLGVWALPKREAIARALIERVDTEKIAYCPELFVLDDEEGFAAHQEQCRFAPFECLNPGCGKVNSLMHAAAHDEVCPRKLVPCRLECGVEVAREDVTTHSLTVCAKKPVPCPFQSIGCEEPLVQGELAEHCKSWVEHHLHSFFTANQKTVALVNDQGRQLKIMQKTLEEWQRKQDIELEAMKKVVEKADVKVKQLENELHKVQKESRSNSLGKELSQIKQQLNSFKEKEAAQVAATVQAG